MVVENVSLVMTLPSRGACVSAAAGAANADTHTMTKHPSLRQSVGVRVAAVAAWACLLAGCGGGEEPDSTAPVSQRQLATMVLGQERLGSAAEGLVLDERSGPQSNRAAAEDTVDPEDDGRT